MHLCPRCKLEARISNSKTTVKNGRAVKVYDLVCVNKRCEYGKSGLPIRRITAEYPQNEIDDTVKLCTCGEVLCRLDGDPVISPSCTAEQDGTTLSVTCGACGTVSNFDM